MKIELTAGGVAPAAPKRQMRQTGAMFEKLFSRPLTFNIEAKVVNGNTVLTYPDRSTVTLIGVTHLNGGIFT
jgi:hypothetical protein